MVTVMVMIITITSDVTSRAIQKRKNNFAPLFISQTSFGACLQLTGF